jgi:hypothetical protein
MAKRIRTNSELQNITQKLKIEQHGNRNTTNSNIIHILIKHTITKPNSYCYVYLWLIVISIIFTTVVTN